SSLNDPYDYLTTDDLTFYFYWSNDTGADVVVNVSSVLALNGSILANAYSGWIWSPFWGTGTIGESTVTLSARLNVLEWWNQPPTTPETQFGQFRDVARLSVEGGWAPISGPTDAKEQFVSDAFHLHYDMLHIPRNGVGVFEVTLHADYEVYNGQAWVDFSREDDTILCPSLEIEIVSGPMITPDL
ncbi:MAG: hypothetical protein ABIR57_11965, partial [Aeromicrobium sp.]